MRTCPYCFFRPRLGFAATVATGLMLASAVPHFSAVYYVAPQGNDLNSGSEPNPWRTIQRAADQAVAGDQVWIKAGVYQERVTPANSGSAGNPIVFSSFESDRVTLEGRDIIIPDDLAGLFHIAGKSNIVVRGLRLLNSGPHQDNAGIMILDSRFIALIGNYTSNTFSSGIGAWLSRDVVISGNEVVLPCRGGYQEGITVAGTDSFRVSSNRVFGSFKEGICIKDGSGNGEVFGNLVDSTLKVGIYLDAWDKFVTNVSVCANISRGSLTNMGFTIASEMGGRIENIRVFNNLAYSNRFCGLTVSINGPGGPDGSGPMDGVYICNNTFWDNGWSDWGGGILVDNPHARNVVLRNNICSGNYYFQIAVASNLPIGAVTVDHNLVHPFRDTEDETRGSDFIEADPRFMNRAAADAHLTGDSPAIDTGSSDLPFALAVDFDGQARRFSGIVDIGADEAVLNAVRLTESGGSVETVWEVVPGARCQLERSSGLPGGWLPAGDSLVPERRDLTFRDASPPGRHAFYRLRWLKP